jgi:hypothetical protein
MEHLRSTPILDPALRATLHAELAAAARIPALRPWVLHPQPDLGPRFVGYWRQLSALPRCTRRSLQRQWKRSLAAIALLMALGPVPALAATINVTGACTLVDAITAANTDAPVGGCTAGSGTDTLELVPGSTHGLTAIADTTYGGNGLPLVTSKITIEGHDSTIERAKTGYGDPRFRLLAVSVSGDVTLKDLTLTKGTLDDGQGAGVFNAGALTLSNSSISRNGSRLPGYFGRSGGGIYSNGKLTLTDSTVSGNATYGSGGGVFNTGTATLTNSTVSGNFGISSDIRAGGVGLGGGLFNSGTLTLIRSKVTGNGTGSDGTSESSTHGGGVLNTGILALTDSTVSNNGAGGYYSASGGGIYTTGTATIVNSTVSGNIVDGAVFIAGPTSYGGGVDNGGALTVINSTISGNGAYGHRGVGGGISNRGTLVLTQSTVSDNLGGGVQNGVSLYSTGHTLTLDRTLVSGNTATEVINLDGNTVVANAFNLFGLNGTAGVSGFSPGPRDIVPAGPLGDILAPLSDNGGPTETHALVAGSPAVDAVTRGCPPPFTDQRGLGRPADGDGDGAAACDVGAFELAAQPLPNCETARPTRGCTVNGVANRLCQGTAGGDQIFGTNRDDIIFGSDGSDRINGQSGHDLICGGKGKDILRGQEGRDRVFGGGGDDNLQGGSGNDQLSGEGGRDQLFGDGGDDALDGGADTDRCQGGANGTTGDTAISCETVFGVP